MRRILIDNFDNRNKLPGNEDSKVWIEITDADTALGLAQKTNHTAADGPIVLFINLNLWNSQYEPSAQLGATVLEHIRFTDRFPDGSSNRLNQVPCIIFSSNHSFEQAITEKPENVILCAPGTTYVHLTGQSEGIDLNVDGLGGPFEREKWIEGILRSTVVETDNHTVANWWGAYRLGRVHSALINADFELPEIAPEFEKLENVKAIAFYSGSRSRIDEALGKDVRKSLNKLRRRIADRRIKILHIDDEWANGWTRVLGNILLGGEITEGIKGRFKEFKSSSEGAIRALDTFPVFNIRQPQTFVDDLFHTILPCIENWEPNCVLLDLRLAGVQERGAEIDQMSGVRLLQKLRDTQKGLPVVMTTASNKAWSIEKLMQQGADGYWIKEGLGHGVKPTDSIQNYRRMLELVDRATGEKYRFLAQFAAFIKELSSCNNRWYSSPNWPNGERYTLTAEKVELVDRVLGEVVSLLRSYLHTAVMKYEYRSERDEKHLIAGLVTYLFHVVELVHNPNNLQRDPITQRSFNLKDVMDRRRDNLGNRIREIRNDYGHLEFLFVERLGTFDQLRTFLVGVAAYLDISPNGCTETLSKGQILAFRHYQGAVQKFPKLDGSYV